MTAYRWQAYQHWDGRTAWALVPATARAPGLLDLCSIVRAYRPQGSNDWIVHSQIPGHVGIIQVTERSAPRMKASVGRALATLPNPPSIVGGPNA